MDHFFTIEDVSILQKNTNFLSMIAQKTTAEQYQLYFKLLGSAIKFENTADYTSSAFFFHWTAVVMNEILGLPGSEINGLYFNEKAIMMDYKSEYVRYNRILNYDEWTFRGINDVQPGNEFSPNWEEPIFDKARSDGITEEIIMHYCLNRNDDYKMQLFSMMVCSAIFYETIGRTSYAVKWYKMTSYMVERILNMNCKSIISEYFDQKANILM